MSIQENQRLLEPSSYTLLIADTVLGQFGVHMDASSLLNELRNPQSIYSIIIQAPTLHTLNQLIHTQMVSYQHYIQKKLIEYISKSATLDESSEEEGVDPQLESMEALKKSFLLEKNASREIEQNLFDQIAFTNQIIFSFLQQQSINAMSLHQLDKKVLIEKMAPCIENAKNFRVKLLELREQWRQRAIDYTEKFSGIAAFQIDELTDLELRSELQFFQELGKTAN